MGVLDDVGGVGGRGVGGVAGGALNQPLSLAAAVLLLIALYSTAGDDMAAEVDKLFGEGTCKKVFGDIAPGFDLFLDFFEQLTPYLQEFSRERTQCMSKYSADRIGNA